MIVFSMFSSANREVKWKRKKAKFGSVHWHETYQQAIEQSSDDSEWSLKNKTKQNKNKQTNKQANKNKTKQKPVKTLATDNVTFVLSGEIIPF